MATLLSCLEGHPSAQLCAWNAKLHVRAASLEQAVARAAPRMAVREASSALEAVRSPPLRA
eukprot:8008492-Alexandrium_andersonii.AAC.1